MSFVSTSTKETSKGRMVIQDLTDDHADLLKWFEVNVFKFFPPEVEVIISGSTVLAKYILYSEGRQPFPINDIDVYFKSYSDWKQTRNFINENFGYSYNYENGQTLNLSVAGYTLDLIKPNFDSPRSLFESFDFSIVCAAVCREGGKPFFKASSWFEKDVEDRIIRFHKAFTFDKVHDSDLEKKKTQVLYAIFQRFLKYKARGFDENDLHVLRFLSAVQKEGEVNWKLSQVERINNSRNLV